MIGPFIASLCNPAERNWLARRLRIRMGASQGHGALCNECMHVAHLLQVLVSARKQEAAVKAEREALAARLRGMEAEHGARGRQAAEAVEDLKVR